MSEVGSNRLFTRGPWLGAEATDDVRRWHSLWAGVVTAAAAFATLIAGQLPAGVYLASAALIAPGLFGRLLADASRSLMLFWAVAMAVALAASGGIGGPGAAWLLALFGAALVLRRSPSEAVVLAVLAAVAAWPLGALFDPVPAEATLRWTVTATSLAATGWALVSAMALRREAAETDADLRERTLAAEAARATADAERDAAAEANAGKSRFLANMSHELRTPLNAIMGFADIMRNRLFGPLPDRYAEYAQLIHESGQHLLDLINDILDMSKIEAARYRLAREVFDAREALTATLRLMRPQAEEAGIDLRGVLPDEPVTVDADKRALKQIALNLISNAIKFTPRGGSVTATLTAADGTLELTVADTGVGVTPEDLERLGRPYEQAGDAESRARGTGLGLSLVRAFAGLHGGEMTLQSALGEGTAVTVRMPVLAAEPPPEEAEGQVLPLAGR